MPIILIPIPSGARLFFVPSAARDPEGTPVVPLLQNLPQVEFLRFAFWSLCHEVGQTAS